MLSLLLGQDMCFDFQNYHLYAPYAFLHGRANVDIIPAGALHTFFNPLLDVPSYLFDISTLRDSIRQQKALCVCCARSAA